MVAITRHVFINIFQSEHFSAPKFAMGYEKNMSFLVIRKSPKVWKKSWKDRTGLPVTCSLSYYMEFLPVTLLLCSFAERQSDISGCYAWIQIEKGTCDCEKSSKC